MEKDLAWGWNGVLEGQKNAWKGMGSTKERDGKLWNGGTRMDVEEEEKEVGMEEEMKEDGRICEARVVLSG